MTKDPIKFAGNGENLYIYVKNDPINYYDLSGLQRGGPIPGRTNNNNPALNNRNTFRNQLNNSNLTPRPVRIKPRDPEKTGPGYVFQIGEEFVQNPCMFFGQTCNQYDKICVAWTCDGKPKSTFEDLKNPSLQQCDINDKPPFTIGEKDSPTSVGEPNLNYLNGNGCTCTAYKLL